ncbi:hypothetical protein ACIQPR_48405 [Streptomyces sp. NPDC091280]|uniref:hypothetical protein n=1 Tax=Streptomyces sp. NPDC091280 TaxID=3365984 RepID=UPI00381F44CD
MFDSLLPPTRLTGPGRIPCATVLALNLLVVLVQQAACISSATQSRAPLTAYGDGDFASFTDGGPE